MYQESIYAEAMRRIDERRQRARLTQEQHTTEIEEKIPDIALIHQQLRENCFAIMQIVKREDRQKQLAEMQRSSAEAETMIQDFLAAYGYPADYLDTNYSCVKCNDSGFVDGRPCECLRREIGRVGAERMNASNQLPLCRFETFSLEYYKELPLEQQQAMQQIYERCKAYAEEFSLHSYSLLLRGKTGLGKTHLSLAIAGVLLEKGFSVVYDSSGHLLRQVEKEHFSREQHTDDTMQVLLECDLLIWDDFGTEFDTAFTRSAIYNIINGRLLSHKPMILNTNLTLEALQDRYGDRIISRLISTCLQMQFFGKDVRLQKRMRQERPTT